MSGEPEGRKIESLEDTACPKCHVKGSLAVEVEPQAEGDGYVYTLICMEDLCDLREKGVRL